MADENEQPKKKGQSLVSQAQSMSAKEGIPFVDALIKLDDELRVKRDIQKSKCQYNLHGKQSWTFYSLKVFI